MAGLEGTLNRVLRSDEAQGPPEFVESVRLGLDADLACLRLVTSTNKLVTLGLSSKTESLRAALESAISDGQIGGVIPHQFDKPLAVQETRVGSLLGHDPAVLTPDAWIENISVTEQGGLAGILTLVGNPATSSPLTSEERAALKAMGRLQILAYNEARRCNQLERKLNFITSVSTGLSSSTPIVERLKRTVVVIRDSLDFDSIQLITWNPTRETVLLNALYVKNVGFVPDSTWDALTREEVNESIDQFRRSPTPRLLPEPDNLPTIRPEQRTWMRRNGIQFLVFVPLMHEDEQYGTLVITSRFSRRETEDRLAILTSVGGHVAAILQLSLLLAEVQESYKKLRRSHLSTVETLAVAAEMRDRTTGQHLRNLRDLSQRIGGRLGLSGVELEDLGFAAVVHDIGKLHLPDNVLLKPAKLSAREWRIMRTHPEAGEAILGSSELPQVAREVVRWHHERWDGSGYPDGLKGDQIPLSAQIVAIADVFDALTSERPYKQAWSVEDALEEIWRGRGKHFSPDVTDAFLALDLRSVASRRNLAA